MLVTGFDCQKYIVTFVNAARKLLVTELLPVKASESVIAAFKEVHEILKNTFSNPVKQVHTYNGGGYDNDWMKEYVASYNPISIGVAERANRTALNKFRAIYSSYGRTWGSNIALMQFVKPIT
jgi:hypothetical protein